MRASSPLAVIVDALYRFGGLGDAPDDNDEEKLQHRFLLWMALFMSCGGLVWGSMALGLGFGWRAAIPYGYVALTAANVMRFAATRQFDPARTVQVSVSLLLPFLLQLALGGFVASGAVMLWALLALVGSLTFSSIRQSARWLALFLALTVACGVLDPWLPTRFPGTPEAIQSLLFVVNIGLISAIVFGLTTYVLAIRRQDNAALRDANGVISGLNRTLEAEARRAEAAEAGARAASAAKSAFLANMSHELRTPLNAILGYAELLLEESPTGTEELGRIRGAGQHLLAMINDVLDLAKVESGKMTVDVGPVDLVALAREVVATLGPIAARNGNQLLLEPPDGPVLLQSDEAKLRQILFNLVGNAAKFTSHGTITLRAARTAEGAELRVRDTGVGMTAEQLSRVVHPFEQADSSTTRRFGGTGLGLYLVDQYAQMLGGRLTLTSEPGTGTAVTVTVRGA